MDYGVIKTLAKEKGISLEKIAENADISYNSLSKIIRNTVAEPKYKTLTSIAHSLGLTADDLAILVGLSAPTLTETPANISDDGLDSGKGALLQDLIYELTGLDADALKAVINRAAELLSEQNK